VTSGAGTFTLLGSVTVPSSAETGTAQIHGNVSLNALTRTFDVASNKAFSIDANILDGGITKSSGGLLTLSGTNSYSGATTISGGTLVAAGSASLGNSASTNGIILSGGTLKLGASANTARFLSINPGAIDITGNTLTFSGAGSTTWSGNLSVNGGTLSLARTGGTLIVTSGVNVTIQPGAALSLGGSVAQTSDGTHHVDVINNSTVGLSAAGVQRVGNIDGTGNTSIASGASLTASHIRQNALTLAGTGRTTVRANGQLAGISYLNSLTINAGGTLDLNDNDLVVNNGTFSTIQSLVIQGYSAAPDTTKTGIISTMGQAQNGDAILALFNNALFGVTDYPFGSGNSIANGAIVGKYTYIGDTDWNGQVDPQDYTAIDANLGATGLDPGSAWFSGDTNFDNSIDPSDYTGVDAALGLGVGNPLSAQGLAAVPEPVALAPIVMGAMLAIRRRRSAD
jgi:autotransporter-associated beta strand protein